MHPAQVSRELRTARSPDMTRRRGVVALALAASAAMGVISLYQTGLIPHLPEPPIPRLNADKVDASEEAYAKLRMPDGLLGLASYAVTASLAAMGGADRTRRHPWLALLLAGKVGVDAVQAGKLTWDQWAKHKAFCGYCLLAAAATFAMVPLAVPGAVEAGKRVLGRMSWR